MSVGPSGGVRAGERSRLIPTSLLHEIHRLAGGHAGDVIELHVGEPHVRMPEAAAEGLVRAVRDGHTRYTDASGLRELCAVLAAKLAERNGVEAAPEQVFVTPGSCEGISAVMQSVAFDGGVALLGEVHWPMHLQQVRLAGLTPRFYRNTAGPEALVASLEELATPEACLLLVNSPANPSGQVLGADVLRRVHAWAAARRVWVVSDEAYEDFLYGGAPVSMGAFDAALPPAERVVFSTYTFSKGFSMTGCRLGYVATPNLERAELLRRVQEATLVSPSTPVQLAGLAALGAPEHLAAHRRYVAATRDEVVRILDAERLLWAAPDGGWYALVDLSRHTGDSRRFCHGLLARAGVALAPGAAFFPEGSPVGGGLARLTLCAGREATVEGVRRLVDHLRALAAGDAGAPA